MKGKGQVLEADGFDRIIAEKMPKMKKAEEPFYSVKKEEPPVFEEPKEERLERRVERKVLFETPDAPFSSGDLDLSALIEDLHHQLLLSQKAQKAMELDRISYDRKIHQLTQENKDLQSKLEGLQKELQRLKENAFELNYLKEENEEALERIRELQQELRVTKDTLTKILKEKEEASRRVQELEYQLDQLELTRMKERLKEKETSHFNEENLQLRAKLEETLAQNLELEKKYEVLKRSFQEVKESLTLLRDSCKKNYYQISDPPD
jgi:chromosome segregation ATPase